MKHRSTRAVAVARVGLVAVVFALSGQGGERKSVEPPRGTTAPIVRQGSAPAPPSPVVIRGGEGIPFPNPTQVVLPPEPTPTPGPTLPPMPTPKPWVRPGRCEANRTEREEHSPGESDGVVEYQRLFVAEDMVPLDPEEVYGAKIKLFPYGGAEDKATETRMKMYNVPCLPFRIRMTRRSYFYDTGGNALKNYDKNQSGSGVFHPWVENRLFGNAPRKR